MNKILIINGGQRFKQSEGKFNKMLSEWSTDFFVKRPNTEIKIVDINEDYLPEEEVKKFAWADFIIYHVPIWWFQVPFRLKEYLDRVLTAGHENDIYHGNAKTHKDDSPRLGYGAMSGLLAGKSYMLSTTWNAPREAFMVRGEFFNLHNVDEVMLGFHKMNKFIGLTKTDSIHFYDVMKVLTKDELKMYNKAYHEHLERIYLATLKQNNLLSEKIIS